MKRGKPLRADPEKTRAWQRRSAEKAAAKVAEQGRAPLRRESTGLGTDGGTAKSAAGNLSRRVALKAKAKPPIDPVLRAAMAAWRRKVVPPTARCITPGCRSGTRLAGHHVIRQSVLDRIAEDLGWPVERVTWNPAFGVCVCEAEHDEHTRRHRRIPGSLIPAAAWIAAEELDDALEAAGGERRAIMELRREHP